jgi:dipeptide/tripeptide permease
VFLRIAMITAAGGAVLLLLVPVLKRMMHGVK